MVQSAEAPAPTWYVTNGLVMHLDAIDNEGTGVHSSSPSAWVDLSGNNRDITTLHGSWGTNYFRPSKRNAATTGLARSAYKHVEIVVGSCINNETNKVLHAQGNNVGTIWTSWTGWFYTSAGSTAYYGTPLSQGRDTSNYIMNALSVAADARQPSIVYKDGEPVLTDGRYKTTVTWGSNSSNTAYFGYATNTNPYDYRIHSLRFYDHVLSASEILNNWQIDVQRFGVTKKIYTAPYSIPDTTRTGSTGYTLTVTNTNHVVLTNSSTSVIYVAPTGAITNGSSAQYGYPGVPWFSYNVGDSVRVLVKNLDYTNNTANDVNITLGFTCVGATAVLCPAKYTATAGTSDTGKTAEYYAASATAGRVITGIAVTFENNTTDGCTAEFDFEVYINNVRIL